MIGEMRDAGKTVLVSTHIIDSIDMIWDQAVIMEGGKVKLVITKKELDEKGRTLEELFFEVTEGNKEENDKKECEQA